MSWTARGQLPWMNGVVRSSIENLREGVTVFSRNVDDGDVIWEVAFDETKWAPAQGWTRVGSGFEMHTEIFTLSTTIPEIQSFWPSKSEAIEATQGALVPKTQ